VAAVYLPGVVTIVPEYDIHGIAMAANVFHFQGQSISFSTSQLTAIQSAWEGAWATPYAGLCPSGTSYLGANVIDSGSALGQEVTNTAHIPNIGTLTGGPMADNQAVLLSLHGLHRYKGGHCRKYLPGMAYLVTQNDGRLLGDTYKASIGNMWQGVVTALNNVSTANGGPFKPIIWHKKWKAAPNSPEDVVGYTVQSVLASQRRRLRKVSRHRKATAMAAARAELVAEYSLLRPLP